MTYIVLHFFNSWQFLWHGDSVTTDTMWACPAVSTSDLSPSFKRPTETLRELNAWLDPVQTGLSLLSSTKDQEAHSSCPYSFSRPYCLWQKLLTMIWIPLPLSLISDEQLNYDLHCCHVTQRSKVTDLRSNDALIAWVVLRNARENESLFWQHIFQISRDKCLKHKLKI